MSSNSCLFPINFVILCQGDLKKKRTNLNLPLPWLKLFNGFLLSLESTLQARLGPLLCPCSPGHYLFLALTLLESLTLELITIFNICCLHRTSGGSLVSGSLWALHESWQSDSQGPRMWRRKHWSILLAGLPLHVIAWHLLELESPHLRNHCSRFSSWFSLPPIQRILLYLKFRLAIWSSLPANCQNFFTSGHTERGIFVCHTGCCCLKPEATPAGALAAPRAEWINILTIAHVRHTGWDALL